MEPGACPNDAGRESCSLEDMAAQLSRSPRASAALRLRVGLELRLLRSAQT